MQKEEATGRSKHGSFFQESNPRSGSENREPDWFSVLTRFSPGSRFLTGSRLSVLIRFSHSRPTENRVQNLGSRFSGHPVLAFSSGSRFSPGFWMQVRRRLKLESRGSPDQGKLRWHTVDLFTPPTFFGRPLAYNSHYCKPGTH